MANSAGTAYIDVEADTGKATKDIERDIGRAADNAGKDVESKLGGALRSVGTMFARLSVAAGGAFGAIGVYGLKAAADFQQTRIAFEGILGSAEKAQAMLTDLRKFAATTPFEFPELASASKALLSVGFAAKDVIPIMTKLGNVAATLGVGAEAINGVVRALGQMKGKGKASAEELQQISEQVPGFSAIKVIAEKLGITVAQAFSKMEKGAISADVAIEAILEGMEKFPGAAGAMERQSQTLNGVISTLKDTFRDALIDGIEPYLPAIAAGITKATPLIRTGVAGMIEALKTGILGVKAFYEAFSGGDNDGSSGIERLGLAVRRTVDVAKVAFDEFKEAFSSFRKFGETDASGPFEKLGVAVAKLTQLDLSKIKTALADVDWGNIGAGVSIFAAGLQLVANNSELVIKALPFVAAGWLAINVAQGINNTIGRDSVIGMALQVGSTLSLAASNRTLAAAMGSVTLAAGSQTAAVGVGTAAVGGMSLAAAGAAAAIGTALAGAIVVASRAADEHVPFLKRIDQAFIGLESRIPLVGGVLAALDRKVLGFGDSTDTAKDKTNDLRAALERVSGDYLARISLDTNGAEAKLNALQAKMDAIGVQANARSLAADSGDISGPISRAPRVAEESPTATGDGGSSSPEYALGMDMGPVPGRRNERVPIIAHGGEWVLTPEQMAGLRSGRSGGSSAAPGVMGPSATEIGVAVAAAMAANPSRSYVVASDLAKGLHDSRRR